ncbi:MAG: Lytic transglycosylase, catalytic [Bryobacterales bacterium]|nr:Lytic transglycosylase, catalytic [Bryobacterales bacterium]
MVILALTVSALSVFAQQGAALQNASVAMQEQAIAEKMRASIERQVASVRKQGNLAVDRPVGFFVMAEPEASFDQDFACTALTPMRATRLVDDAARRTGVSADLIHAVIQQESAFRPCAVSNKGARGLMQLMPATMEEFGVVDGFDPDQNVSAGAALLKQLLARYSGDLNRVLGAYNAGTARADAVDGVPQIAETRDYVDRILGSLAPRLLP